MHTYLAFTKPLFIVFHPDTLIVCTVHIARLSPTMAQPLSSSAQPTDVYGGGQSLWRIQWLGCFMSSRKLLFTNIPAVLSQMRLPLLYSTLASTKHAPGSLVKMSREPSIHQPLVMSAARKRLGLGKTASCLERVLNSGLIWDATVLSKTGTRQLASGKRC